jgi:hypothetical protein
MSRDSRSIRERLHARSWKKFLAPGLDCDKQKRAGACGAEESSTKHTRNAGIEPDQQTNGLTIAIHLMLHLQASQLQIVQYNVPFENAYKPCRRTPKQRPQTQNNTEHLAKMDITSSVDNFAPENANVEKKIG